MCVYIYIYSVHIFIHAYEFVLTLA
jgi:hypothetical protein